MEKKEWDEEVFRKWEQHAHWLKDNEIKGTKGSLVWGRM